MNAQINFLTVLITVFALVLMMVPGYIFAKLKLLPEKASETCSTIVMYCCQTALVFSAFVTKTYTPSIGKNILIVFLIAVAVHLIMIGLVSIIFKSSEGKAAIIKYSSVFSNCGFMGIPFLKMLFAGHGSADDVLIYAAAVIAAFNLVNWTFGVLIVTGDKKQISFKKILLNPVIIAVVAGFLIFVILQKPITEVGGEGTFINNVIGKIMASIDAFGDMVTPLSMFTIGMKLCGVQLKQLFMDIWAYLSSALKLILMPLITILIVAFLPLGVEVKYSLFLLLAMPTATSATLFSVLFNKDSSFASVCVLLSTILSVVTIPLMYLVMSKLFGVVI